GNTAGAEEQARKVLALHEQLIRKKRGAVPEYVQIYATAQTILGGVLLRKGKRAEAEAAFQQSFDLHDGLLRDHPLAPDHPWNLFIVFTQLSPLVETDPPRVLKLCDRVIEALEGVRPRTPPAQQPRLRIALSTVRAARAEDALTA